MKLIRYITFALLTTVLLQQLMQGHVGAAMFLTFGLFAFCDFRSVRCAANDFGALANSILVHDLMEDFRNDLSPLLNLTMDVGTEISDGGLLRTLRPGQTVTFSNYFQAATPYNVHDAGGYVAEDHTVGTPVTITMPSDPWAASRSITPEEFRLLTGGPRVNAAYDSLRKKLNEGLMYGLKAKMVADFFALITSSNYTTNFVSSVGTFSRSTEIDLDTKLFSRCKKDLSEAQIILPPTPFGEWAKDHVAVNTYTGGAQKGRLMGGGISSDMSNFTFWRTNVDMPADAARGFAYMKKAAAFISRIPDEPGLGTAPTTGSDTFNSLATVVDDMSKIAFLVRTWKNWQTGAIQLDIAIIYKFGVFQPEFLERITAS